MTHYSQDPSKTRVDIFRKSGKWNTTIEVKWRDYDAIDIRGYFKHLMQEAGFVWDDYNYCAVCLEPYHKHGHPIMIKEW